jgi:hypothetical protein
MAMAYINDLGVTYEKHVVRRIEIYEVVCDVCVSLGTELM